MGINVFTASGNLGSDLDVRFTQNGKAIGTVSVTVKSGWGDNEKTSWVTIKLLGKKAEGLGPYLRKGSLVTFTGEFILEQWEKDGVKHSRPVVVVNDIQLPAKQSQGSQQGGYQQQQNPAYQNQPNPGGQQPQSGPSFDDDLDIPF